MKVELHQIRKHYGPVRANDGVSLTVEPGTIHGILGENGAGKSTLMKILSGFIPRTGGTIRLDDADADFRNPAEAAMRGIGMLYQDPLDFPLLTVLDNFRLGHPVRPSKAARIRFAEGLRRFNFHLDHDAPLRSLTVGERQQLEILRLLELGVGVLILDEPTTGISETQKALLFSALRQLAAEGKSVIIVSHKLEDAEALCDRLTVLRQGRVAGEAERPFNTGKIMEMMFGTPPPPPERRGISPGAPLLIMDGVHAAGGRTGLKDCSATIREGEVVGLAGLEGSGQGMFLRLAAGLKFPVRGEIRFRGTRLTGRNYHFLKSEGCRFLPASRLEEGLIPGMDISEHMALQPERSGFWVKWPRAKAEAVSRIRRFRIKGTPHSAVESLSGGNQQRLLLSFLSADSSSDQKSEPASAPVSDLVSNLALLLLENPTRGLDMESANWVWRHLQTTCDDGTAVVFSSSELDEILMVADRILVFFDGRIIMDVKAENTDVKELGLAIAGKG